MTALESAAIRVSDPAELIEVVPYLLGFHPADSLVVVGLSGATPIRRSRVQIVLRMDLPRDDPDPAVFDEILSTVVRNEVDVLAAILFVDGIAEPRSDPALAELTDSLLVATELAAVEVLDVLVASRSTWWSFCCPDSVCCPPKGRQRRGESAVSVAAATYAGLVAVADRGQVEARFEGLRAADREQFRHRIERGLSRNDGSDERRQSAVAAFWVAAARAPSSRIDDERLCELAAALRDITIRDDVWLALDGDEEGLDARALLSQLYSRAPSPYDAAALFLYGWSCWRDGDGTSAAIASEQALSSDSGYSAADLLLSAVRHGVDPQRLPPLQGGGSERTSPWPDR